MNNAGELKAYIAAGIAAFLLIADANGWFKVPTEAITLITSVLIGSRAVVGVSKNYAAGKLAEGASPSNETQAALISRLK